MATKKSFVLFTDRKKEIDMLSDAQCGVLFKAILRYADTGERLESDDLVLQVLFSVFTSQIDECAEKWEEAKRKRVEAGKKGGAPKGNRNAAKEKGGATEKQPKQAKTSNACLKQPKQAKQAVTVTDTVTGTVTVPVTNKPPDGTAPNGAAPPAISKEGDVVPWDEVDFDLV
nr:MAG TPA: hypothetical protein [Caudoviricetes sp.]